VQMVDDPVHGSLRLVADPIRFDGLVLPVRLPPPALGADTDDVLGEP
jgi:crotonobetainyl-CoA:carnitine CoA-transferase CaiB-like acyl-CoA transferase